MRAPSEAIVLDTSILITSVLGKRRGAINVVQHAAVIVTTERVVDEARRRIELGLKRPDLIQTLEELVAEIPIVPMAELATLLASSETALKDAAASRNGSTRDAHVLALAWSARADIWSADRDFAGTGVASWSTANLIRALAQRGAPA